MPMRGFALLLRLCLSACWTWCSPLPPAALLAPCPSLHSSTVQPFHPLQVLSRANHSADDMLAAVAASTAAAVARGDMQPEVAERLVAAYTARMHGYT